MFAVAYFLFVICLCIFAVINTIVVLHMYLRAEGTLMVPMPAWVSHLFFLNCEIFTQSTNSSGWSCMSADFGDS